MQQNAHLYVFVKFISTLLYAHQHTQIPWHGKMNRINMLKKDDKRRLLELLPPTCLSALIITQRHHRGAEEEKNKHENKVSLRQMPNKIHAELGQCSLSIRVSLGFSNRF